MVFSDQAEPMAAMTWHPMVIASVAVGRASNEEYLLPLKMIQSQQSGPNYAHFRQISALFRYGCPKSENLECWQDRQMAYLEWLLMLRSMEKSEDPSV